MTESTATSNPQPPQKKAAKPKKAKSAAPQSPKTSAMGLNAVKIQHGRNGSSLQAINKFLTAEYKVDVDKRSSLIRKCLKTAISDGTLVQTKGKGANGSFKLNSSSEKKTVKKTSSKKPVVKKMTPSKKSSTQKSSTKKTTPAAKKSTPKKLVKKTPKLKGTTTKPLAKAPKQEENYSKRRKSRKRSNVL